MSAENLTSEVLIGLAVVGLLALLLRLFMSAGRTVLNSAELAAAIGVAETSARRGDLTRMQEGRSIERRARAARSRAALVTLFWLTWIILPLMLGYLPVGYAVAAPLWLFRGRRLHEPGAVS